MDENRSQVKWERAGGKGEKQRLPRKKDKVKWVKGRHVHPWAPISVLGWVGRVEKEAFSSSAPLVLGYDCRREVEGGYSSSPLWSGVAWVCEILVWSTRVKARLVPAL